MKNKFWLKSIEFLSQKVQLESLIKKSAFKFIAPFYHIISNENLDHISGLYPIKSVNTFKNELELFLKYYKPISENELIAYIQQHNTLPKKKFFLTFDDGFKECESIIAPILKNYGIPATFFINAAFIDNKEMMFRNAAQCISKNDNAGANFVNSYLKKQQPYLSTVQVKKLVADGFSIGCHSFGHPYFSKINLKSQIEELDLNSTYFKKNNLLVKSFAFPFTDVGVKSNFFEVLKERFEISFACAGLKNDAISNHIQRIAMESNFHKNGNALLKYQFLKFAYLKKINKTLAQR